MFRTLIASLLAAGMTVGCASTQPVTSGGYYCRAGTQLSCASHEGSGDCQNCPNATVASTVAATSPAVLPGRPD